ncbi:MAG: hypothetical protein ACUVRP_02555 [Chlorobiales bacterium]
MKHRATKLRTFATVQQHIHSDPTLERHHLTELNQTAWAFRLMDRPKSRTLALEAKDLATRLEKTDELAQSLLTLAVVSFQGGKLATRKSLPPHCSTWATPISANADSQMRSATTTKA